MYEPDHIPSPSSDAISELILEVFRLNGRLLDAGDALVADIALTSARWQVMGAIALSTVPLPVAHLARNMGLSRQSVQRLANEMEKDGRCSRFDRLNSEALYLAGKGGVAGNPG